ncbi:MAG: metallophosphoesterase [Lachnospiraceae bacterium]|jgi:putative phosphoesterase
MKISFIADLHLDLCPEIPVIDTVAKVAQERGSDLIVIAGDICEAPDLTEEVIKQFGRLDDCPPVLFVPGNHDLWNRDTVNWTNEYIYTRFSSNPQCLINKAFDLGGGTVILGNVGWYDYSFGAPVYSKEAFDTMTYHDVVWHDHDFNKEWTADNQAKCAEQLKLLEDQLKIATDRMHAKQIIAVTHMVPIREMTVPYDMRPEWERFRYFNAFVGSERLGEIYEKYPVKYAVCGHVHFRRQLDKNGIHYISPSLGLQEEWKLFGAADTDVRTQVEDAMVTIEV